MPFGWDDLLRGILAPAVAALLVFVIWRLLGGRGTAERVAGAQAAAAGFLVAYLLFPWTKTPPVEHWQWLPWLGLAAAATGPAAAADGARWVDRLALRLVLGLAAAWALVPTWAETRLLHVAVLGGGLVLLCLALDGLPARVSGAALSWSLCASAGAGAFVIAVSGILSFAQLGGASAAALGGIAVGSLLVRREMPLRGSADVFAVLVGGVLYAGWLGGSFSRVPMVSFVLPAVAPACLWVCTARGSVNRSPLTKFATGLAAVGVPLAVAVAWAVVVEPIWAD